MTARRVFAPTAAVVTLGLVDGSEQTGHLSTFDPVLPDIHLTLAVGRAPRSMFAAERVAFVAFHKSAGEPPALPGARPGSLKLHVVGKRTFLVDPSEPDAPGSIGFYARPAEPLSPYRELYFYNHGISLKEINEPLGAMLVREGRLAAPELAKGLEAQKDQQRTPIGEILVEYRRLDQSALDEATALQQRRGTRLGEVLIEAGLATAADVEAALAEQRKRTGKRIGQILVEMNLVSEVDLSATLARKFHLPFVDLDVCGINLAAVEELPPRLHRQEQDPPRSQRCSRAHRGDGRSLGDRRHRLRQDPLEEADLRGDRHSQPARPVHPEPTWIR